MAAVFDGPLLGGRFRLGPPLGTGGQGRTYLARDERSVGGEKRVAVKQLRLSTESGWKRFDLFERELRTLKSLDHPGIPRFIAEIEEPAGTHHIVMAKAPGATLRAIATRARFTDDELRDILGRTLDILVYLHAQNVVHRDVKPANLLRDADGKVSLVDFGAVLEATREGDGSTVVGTFGYMAPEQLHGAARPATDLYGLGATVVALAGNVEPEKVPRKGLRMNLERHLPDMDRSLRALVQRMVEPDPESRPASARAVLAELRAAPVAPAPPPLAQNQPEPALDDDILPAAGSLPRPLMGVLLFFLTLVGAFGAAAFYIFDMVLAPFGFAVARAFVSPPTRKRLAAKEKDVRDTLRGVRGGFQALARRGAHGLSPAPTRPRLPRGKR